MNDYHKIAAVIQYLETHQTDQPDLGTLADHVGLSRHHFHRLFSRWAGITPKDFLKCLTVSHAKGLLRDGESVLNTALDLGLSGPGRLHDLCITMESASPGELKSGDAGWTITSGFVSTPFGNCLVGSSPRGICHLAFVEHKNRSEGQEDILSNWPNAKIKWNHDEIASIIEPIFDSNADSTSNLRAIVRGSQFQVRVWRALMQVPEGCLVSYGQLAQTVCSTRAAQAVGNAVARNPLAYLIPCHRVIRATGAINEYRWGGIRKKAMIARECGSSLAAQSTVTA